MRKSPVFGALFFGGRSAFGTSAVRAAPPPFDYRRPTAPYPRAPGNILCSTPSRLMKVCMIAPPIWDRISAAIR